MWIPQHKDLAGGNLKAWSSKKVQKLVSHTGEQPKTWECLKFRRTCCILKERVDMWILHFNFETYYWDGNKLIVQKQEQKKATIRKYWKSVFLTTTTVRYSAFWKYMKESSFSYVVRPISLLQLRNSEGLKRVVAFVQYMEITPPQDLAEQVSGSIYVRCYSFDKINPSVSGKELQAGCAAAGQW